MTQEFIDIQTSITEKCIYKRFKTFKIGKNHVDIQMPKSKNGKQSYREFRKEVYRLMYIPMYEVGDVFRLDTYSAKKFLSIVEKHTRNSNLKGRITKFMKDNSRTAKSSVYAAGAIEHADDFGVGSRVVFRNVMKFTPIDVISPCDFSYNQDDYPTMKSFQRDHNAEETYYYSIPIVEGDLQAVAECEALTVYLDEQCSTGTGSEASVANQLGKPVYTIIADGTDLRKVHPWLLGCTHKFFTSFNEFREFVIKDD